MKTCTTTPFRKASLFYSGHVLLLAALLLLALLAGCNRTELKDHEHHGHHHDATAKTTTRYGRTLPLGGGVARTYVTTNRDGKPVSVGVVLSEKALTDLPQEHGPVHDGYEYALPFPEGNVTPFQVLGLHWNPHGHSPAPIYTRPHFDFHFYMISDEERRAIPGLPDTVQDPAPPAPRYLHPDYITGPGRIAAMGSHWVDRFAPELGGATFTHTFLMGSYQHKVIFYEPMITLAYILSRPQATFSIKQPQAFAQKGYYPTNYRIEYDEKAKEYRIALLDFVLREAQ